MILDRFELEAVQLPMRRKLETGAGTLEVREGFLLQVEAEGVTGVGEAMPLPSAGTETLEQCGAALEQAQRLAGQELDDVEAMLEDVPTFDAAPCARFAAETALRDLKSKVLGRPFLKAAEHKSVAVNALIDLSVDPAERARELKAQGFTCFKLKLPKDVAVAIAHTAQVREVIGARAELRLDANSQWSLAEAREVLSAVAHFGPAYCEDPLANIEELTELKATSPVRLAADAWLQHAIANPNLADVWILKPAAIGGVFRALELAKTAKGHGIEVRVTTTLEGVIARLAALHLAAALEDDVAHGLATGAWISQDWAVDPSPVVAGRMVVPTASGLGVTVLRPKHVPPGVVIRRAEVTP